ncbi:MAG TPA: hypothetical protein VM937_08800 [Burkholderiaceae bacterium]|jgi:hypothetical protein|nr:hypothetical protein [Burkholderiaceae bacterium]
MKKPLQFKAVTAACVIALLAAGCGSSSDDSGPPPPAPSPIDTMAQEDAAASASVAGFIAFLQAVIASLTVETNEPRSIGGITPPVTETAEPTAI